jgi:hypothetical protein
VLGDVRLAQCPAEAFPGQTFAAASAMVFVSPVTMASIAVMTFFEIFLGDSTGSPVGGGVNGLKGALCGGDVFHDQHRRLHPAKRNAL